MSAKRFTGKTESDAVMNAAMELGIPSTDLKYTEIDSGSNGFLGLFKKPVIIEIKEEEKETEVMKSQTIEKEQPKKKAEKKDQGWQYQHAYYRNRLSKHGIIQSMSRKGNYYYNSIMETFFGSRKHFILFASYFFHHIKTPDSKGWNSGVVHTNGVEQNARWNRSASLVATEQSSCDI